MPGFIEFGQKKGANAIIIDVKLESVGYRLLTDMVDIRLSLVRLNGNLKRLCMVLPRGSRVAAIPVQATFNART